MLLQQNENYIKYLMKFHFSILIFSLLILMQACIGTDIIEDVTISETFTQIEIELPGSSPEVFVNQSFTLTVIFLDDNGQVVSGANIDWLSTNTEVAVVDGNGQVSTLQTGQTDIIATSGSYSDTLALNVVNNPDQITTVSIATAQNQSSLLIGDTLRVSATLRNAEDEIIENQEGLTWTSSNEQILTIDQNGLITAVSDGQATVQAEIMGIQSDELLISVTVNPDALAEIELQTSTNRIEIGENLQFTARGLNGLGNELTGLTFTWESDNTDVLSIDQNGLTQALTGGVAQVTASVDGFKSAPFEVTVVDVNQVTSLVISTPSNALLVGETIQLTALASNANGDPINPPSITWQSSNTALLTVDASGLATANDVGTVQVSAIVDGVTSNILTFSINPDQNNMSRSGNFVGVNGYRVTGDATIQSENGVVSLDFASNFSTSNGPGLYVYLSNQPNSINGGFEVGALKNTSGAQTYSLPASVEVNDFNFVLIFCKPFRLPFGNAEFEE